MTPPLMVKERPMIIKAEKLSTDTYDGCLGAADQRKPVKSAGSRASLVAKPPCSSHLSHPTIRLIEFVGLRRLAASEIDPI